jgi:hypothetical protein
MVANMPITAKFIIKGANISSNTLITEENLSTKIVWNSQKNVYLEKNVEILCSLLRILISNCISTRISIEPKVIEKKILNMGVQLCEKNCLFKYS